MKRKFRFSVLRLAAFALTAWHDERWTIQNWLERTAWKTLQGTRYGRDVAEPSPSPFLWDDPLLRQIYLLDIASFITAERT